MEQRPLRLGDIVDDYCPQERRLTNHVVVVILEDVIRKTRCTTCDAEHAYKSGLVPRRRKKEDELAEAAAQLVKAAPTAPGSPESDPDPQPMAASNGSAADPASDPPENGAQEGRDDGGWMAHRPLIRAQLPRTEGETPTPRPIPEFTIYQRSRGGHQHFRQPHGFRDVNGNSNGRPERDGNVAGAGDHNFNTSAPFNRGGRGPGRPGIPAPPFVGGGGDQPRHGRRRRRRHGKKPQ